MSAVRAQGLHLGYGADDVVRGIDLDVPVGSTVAILGPSGGGKSTLLKAIAGLLRPRDGTLDVLDARHPRRPPRGSVGYVPQRLGLVRHTSVLDNIQHGALHETRWWDSLLHRGPSDLQQRTDDALAAVGLTDKAHEVIHRLSGGQQRRAAVARALVQRPRLLLADEFLGELDPVTTDVVMRAVKAQQAETGMTVVMVEHRLEAARRMADTVYRMERGRLEVVDGDA